MPSIPPRAFRRAHGIATLVWAALIIPSVTVWRNSVTWIVIMSVWANLAAHFSAYQGARAEQENNGSGT